MFNLLSQERPLPRQCVKKLVTIKDGVQRKVKQTCSTSNKQQRALEKELRECYKSVNSLLTTALST